MIHKQQIAQMAKKILHRQGGLHDYQIMHPMRDWVIGLSIALTIFVVGAATSAQLYVTNMNALLESDGAAEEVVVYRESAVQTALKRLRDRDTVFQATIGGRTQPVIESTATSTPTTTPESVEEVSVSTTTLPSDDEAQIAPL